jgi:hypothetical protein
MKSNPAALSIVRQAGSAETVVATRKPVKHTVPGSITREMRALILSELRGGRSAVQVAKEYNVVVAVVLEIWCRDIERRVLGRAA